MTWMLITVTALDHLQVESGPVCLNRAGGHQPSPVGGTVEPSERIEEPPSQWAGASSESATGGD